MEFLSFLPLVGGGVTLAIGLSFMKKHGVKEKSQLFFFLSLVCLGVFGILETVAYSLDSKDAAYLVFIVSKAFAFCAPFFVMAFATNIRAESRVYRVLMIPLLAVLIISILGALEDIEKVSWGWKVIFRSPMEIVTTMMVIFFMSIAIYELARLLDGMKAENDLYYPCMLVITIGFVFWLLSAIVANAIVIYMGLDVPPLFSFVQVFPAILVAYGYSLGSSKGMCGQ